VLVLPMSLDDNNNALQEAAMSARSQRQTQRLLGKVVQATKVSRDLERERTRERKNLLLHVWFEDAVRATQCYGNCLLNVFRLYF